MGVTFYFKCVLDQIKQQGGKLKPEMISLLRRCQHIQDLKTLKSLIIVHGLIHSEPLTTEFIRQCFHLSAPELALSAFREFGRPGLTLRNLMVKRLCDNGMFEDVLSVYKRSRLPSDNYTFPFVIKACSVLAAFDFGTEVHSVVMRSGFDGNVFVQTSLLVFYARCGQMCNARKVFDEIPQPDLVSWNALISGYSFNEEYIDVFNAFRELVVIGLKPNDSTFVSTIPVCTRSGCFQTGMSLHSFTVKSGYSLNEIVTPSLISLYAASGNLSFAQNLFDCLPVKSISTWNSMISAYTKNHKPYDALSMFRRLLESDLEPNSITFICVVPSLEDLSSVLLCGSVHAHAIKCRLGDELPLMTSFLSMYAKLGDLNSAEFLFGQMSSRNLLSWNSMISAYAKNGYADMALVMFCDVHLSSVLPDAVSFISIFLSCSELRALLLGKSAHGYCIKRGFHLDIKLSNSILSFYSDCHWLSTCFKVFDGMEIRNTDSWNTMISGSMNNNEAEMAVNVFRRMQHEGACFDVVTVISILRFGRFGMEVHGRAIQAGFVPDVSVENALISMYVNCDRLRDANLVFENMEFRTVVSWNAIMTGFRYRMLLDRVMVLFRRMVCGNNREPNYVTYLNLLPACRSSYQGKSIHGFAVRIGIVYEASLLTSIILMYARFDLIDCCCSLFEISNKMNVSIWNSIVSACVQTKNPEKAIYFFNRLLRTNVKPDGITVIGLISGLIQISDLNLADLALSYATKTGFIGGVAVANALIDLYARCGNVSTARMLFESSVEKDAISWSVMINGHGLNGECESAISLLSRMELSGVKPDAITYLSALSACSHAGLVEECFGILDSMSKYGTMPAMEHYACVVDLLGRKGYVKEAYDMIKTLPEKAPAGVLESLMGACFSHGDYVIGEEIGRVLVKREPTNSGYYVMLHNVLAAAGKWSEASRLRSNIETLGLRKMPGFSLG